MTAALSLCAALGLRLIAVAAGEAATTPASKGTRVPGGAKAGTPCYGIASTGSFRYPRC